MVSKRNNYKYLEIISLLLISLFYNSYSLQFWTDSWSFSNLSNISNDVPNMDFLARTCNCFFVFNTTFIWIWWAKICFQPRWRTMRCGLKLLDLEFRIICQKIKPHFSVDRRCSLPNQQVSASLLLNKLHCTILKKCRFLILHASFWTCCMNR